MKPFVGAPVHYVSYGTPRGEYKSVCRHAVVTEVGAWVTRGGEDETDEWGDGGVTYRQLLQAFEPRACALKIENPTGTFNNVCEFDVPPVDENGELTHTPGRWHWPANGCA